MRSAVRMRVRQRGLRSEQRLHCLVAADQDQRTSVMQGLDIALGRMLVQPGADQEREEMAVADVVDLAGMPTCEGGERLAIDRGETASMRRRRTSGEAAHAAVAGLPGERAEWSIGRDGAGEVARRIAVVVRCSGEDADVIAIDASRQKTLDGVLGRGVVLV